ncbi:hypothetical protein ACSQ67_010087 [Phaseolus vulgaris]
MRSKTVGLCIQAAVLLGGSLEINVTNITVNERAHEVEAPRDE